MNRGDVYWVNLDPTTGSEINKLRPCVLVGATPINQARRTVVVVPLSSSATARPPITITVSCLGKQVTAVCDQIRTIDKSRLKKVAGNLSDKDLNALDDGLRQVLCL
ncbi:TPA: type II toxin-antitoxin system PemK/MazF family toxin [Legionella pneumophila]|uniref:mRNA interferase n=9 Tax=Legionellaceae TaxID=444 RepID=A0A378KL84_9GAMM|nr:MULTISPECIES: type II toxin-antitoxin system PemK/MazF family toxin [Legionellaceae]HAT8715346.1 type II toxin-antitoxin system PemK/MazF family toxin [Legionella jordanis]AMV16183.1 mRNA interferase MazF9 [Legionella pneumophila]AUH74129.1 type II toxin-antitoxin system PemK/MazF family toxin [Legionella sainthelensi]KTC67586.1 mRNA interferase MazF9 [Legionella anisa]KTC82962.1 mRNA interferase MazF9 [Legionella cherrii]